jgi:hypothetical protein
MAYSKAKLKSNDDRASFRKKFTYMDFAIGFLSFKHILISLTSFLGAQIQAE